MKVHIKVWMDGFEKTLNNMEELNDALKEAKEKREEREDYEKRVNLYYLLVRYGININPLWKERKVIIFSGIINSFLMEKLINEGYKVNYSKKDLTIYF